MHRFIGTSDATRMSLATGANKWASKAVIVLQLAAWSAVGVVLLQKGIVSLQKLPKAGNGTQINETSRSIEAELSTIRHRHSVNEVIDLSVISLTEDPPKKYGARGSRDEGIVSKDDLGRKSFGNQDDQEEAKTQESREANGDSKRAKKIATGLRNELEAESKANKTAGVSSTTRISQDDSVKNESTANSVRLETGEEMESSTLSGVTSRRNRIWEARKKWKMSHIVGGGGGTAAAIAMVTVGAIMLILGPAVVILRALDEKRQERRFVKLSTQDDLPPTYEQATLMEEAPRYSTLSLNTIHASPPPPSPVMTTTVVRLA